MENLPEWVQITGAIIGYILVILTWLIIIALIGFYIYAKIMLEIRRKQFYDNLGEYEKRIIKKYNNVKWWHKEDYSMHMK